MLQIGTAIICRTEEEWNALCKVANKEEYKFSDGRELEVIMMSGLVLPVRISFNTNYISKRCCTYSRDIDYELQPGIAEVHEASDFLHNQIISMKLKGE